MANYYIEGNAGDGSYRVTCDCGSSWHGTAFRFGVTAYSPALPIAECVAHNEMEHPFGMLNVQWSLGFQRWLRQHWEQASMAQARGA